MRPLCHDQQSTISRASKVEPPAGHCCCDSPQYDRLTTTGWALLFRPPTISIMSVLMYTEQPRWQGHGQGKHTCRKQTRDRIIKCRDWFSLLWGRSVYCVGGVVPDCRFRWWATCCLGSRGELRLVGGLHVNGVVSHNGCVVCDFDFFSTRAVGSLARFVFKNMFSLGYWVITRQMFHIVYLKLQR